MSDAERDRWFRTAHVFVMPSRLEADGSGGEGFGIAFLEASAHGLPVVAGNVGGGLDAVLADETGLLVDPTRLEPVADAVIALLRDPERARRLGERGVSWAAENAWPLAARRVEDILLELPGPDER